MSLRPFLLSVCVASFLANPCPAANMGRPENVIDVDLNSPNFYIAPKNTTDCDGLFMGPQSEKFLLNKKLKASLEKDNYKPLLPAIKKRYGGRSGLCVMEVGPLRTTSLAHALKTNYKIYLGLDCQQPSRAQQLFLDSEGLQHARAIAGDIYNLPIADKSQDIVFAFRATPLSSVYCTKESLTRAYKEISRVLKADGEFVLFPQPREEIRGYDPCGSVFEEVSRIEYPPAKGGREPEHLLFYRKR